MLQFSAIYDCFAHAIPQNTVKTSDEPQRDSNGEILMRSLIDKNGKTTIPKNIYQTYESETILDK